MKINPITSGIVLPKGREAYSKLVAERRGGMGRHPGVLTNQLLATLGDSTSVVMIPLEGRKYQTLVGNCTTKARKHKVKFQWAIEGDRLYGWFEKRKA